MPHALVSTRFCAPPKAMLPALCATVHRARRACKWLPRLESNSRLSMQTLAATTPEVGTKRDSIVRPGKHLEDLRFDNTFVRELPGDPEIRNYVRQVMGSLYSRVSPTPAAGEPYMVAYSREVAELLELDPSECERPEMPLIMSGAAPLAGSDPYAQCYGGHQFGSWAGQLGDGRAITLGEVLTSDNRRLELQLKGAGKTPYSRHADGRAVLRSSIREFIGSEALHHLGVPTTRALCVVGTGDAVARDMFYNGNAKMEPGAVVCRVAPSFVRFGTFQLPASRGGEELKLVQQAADYIIRHHYPQLQGMPDVYVRLLEEVTERTGHLVALWQTIGFVHGVLNTDNMSILGLTIDYGPFGFLDQFNPYYTPNLTDADGLRYAFRSQPEIGQSNLVQLANALLAAGLVKKEAAEEALTRYSRVLQDTYQERMSQKLGILTYERPIAVDLMKNMYDDSVDFTLTMRALSSISAAEPSTSSAAEASEEEVPSPLRAAIGYHKLEDDRKTAWRKWLALYRARLRADGLPDAERRKVQDAANPKFIARQHLLQYAIEGAEAGEFTQVQQLLDILRRPFDEQPDVDPKYSSPPPKEMIRAGVCMLSCSS